jgi:hypothetical protein
MQELTKDQKSQKRLHCAATDWLDKPKSAGKVSTATSPLYTRGASQHEEKKFAQKNWVASQNSPIL